MAKGPFRVKDIAGWAFQKITVWTSPDEATINASPTITSGSAVPSSTQPAGSLYLRTGGTTADTILYVRFSGAWTAIKGAT